MSKKKVICFGEVLWDNLPGGRKIGGAPLNVCYHLMKSGIDNRIVSQVGDDQLGTALLKEVTERGINTGFCVITPDYPTSTVEVQVGAGNQVTYEIVEQVAWDFIRVDDRVTQEVRESAAFVYGSLVARNVQSRDTLLYYLSQACWPVFDINLRAPHYTKERILTLLSFCKTLKVNEDEVMQLANWLGLASEQEVITHLLNRFEQLQEVIVTKGGEGVSYYAEQTVKHLPALTVTVVDTVGSGDAFLAAFLAGKLKGLSVEACLQDAIRLSAFVATREGGTPPYDLAEVAATFPSDLV